MLSKKIIINKATFPDIMQNYSHSILVYARRRVGSNLAEDIVSDTFADAWQNRKKFNDGEGNNLEGWLYGIATFVVARHRRAEQKWLKNMYKEATLQDELTDAEYRLDAKSDTKKYLRMLLGLKDHDRDTFLLFALASLSYEDVALVLDIPLGTVRSRINRVRKLIQEMTIKETQ